MHEQDHPLAGKTVKLNQRATDPFQKEVVEGAEYRVENWCDKIAGGSWMTAQGNPAALKYAMRSTFAGIPLDNEVVYGKIGSFGHLVHVSELGEVA